MIHSVLLLGAFWYMYSVYLILFEMRMHPIFLILLTLLLAVFVKTVHPLCDHLVYRHKKVKSHEL